MRKMCVLLKRSWVFVVKQAVSSFRFSDNGWDALHRAADDSTLSAVRQQYHAAARATSHTSSTTAHHPSLPVKRKTN
jgi:hypothetical protein